MTLFPADSDLINLWNGLQDIFSKIPVISLGPVALSLKLECWILNQHINSVKLLQTKRVINIITQPGQQGKGSLVYLCHILSMHPPICLGPFYFTRVPLHFKVLVALRSTESKNLQQEQLWDTVTTHSLWSGAMNKHTHKTKPLIVIGITLPVTYYKVNSEN
jgi:hypothetical protein